MFLSDFSSFSWKKSQNKNFIAISCFLLYSYAFSSVFKNFQTLSSNFMLVKAELRLPSSLKLNFFSSYANNYSSLSFFFLILTCFPQNSRFIILCETFKVFHMTVFDAFQYSKCFSFPFLCKSNISRCIVLFSVFTGSYCMYVLEILYYERIISILLFNFRCSMKRKTVAERLRKTLVTYIQNACGF